MSAQTNNIRLVTLSGVAFFIGLLFGLSTGIVPVAFAEDVDVRSRDVSTQTRVLDNEIDVPEDFFEDQEDLANRIICWVFTEIDEFGTPLSPFPHENCPQEPLPVAPQCSDGIDNDNDGLTDFPADLGCISEDDDDETNAPAPAAQCSDGIDNDEDGFTDIDDPNCHTDNDPTNPDSYDPDRDEAGSLPVCWNGVDDDDDGLIDMDDPGCSNPLDDDETDPTGSIAQCSDAIDNDEDGFIDTDDPNCHTDGDPTNSESYDPNLSEEGTLPVCWNGIDDDEDGLIDLDDPGCSSATDDDETDPVTAPQCSDGIDNDEDGLVDLDDPGCESAGDDDETDPAPAQCSDGIDNDEDGLTDLDDPGCSDSTDNDETDPTNGGGNGGSGGTTITPGGTVVGLIGGVGGDPGITTENGQPIACDAYLTEFIREGRDNDELQVMRLQYVLQDFEGASLEMNGIYDAQTLAAVHTFQTKYASDILTPWGINQSTGYVYLTTRKKVNEIYCKNTKQFPLTEEEQQTIDETLEAVQAIIQVPSTGAGTGGESAPVIPPELLENIGAADADSLAEDDTQAPNESQTASVEGAVSSSLFKRISDQFKKFFEGISESLNEPDPLE